MMRSHSNVLYPVELSVPVETVQERDQRECVALDKRVDGSNRELAQWLLDHPTYTNREVAKWLDCAFSRIGYLRTWAKGGFVKTYRAGSKKKPSDHGRDQEALETNDNSLDDPDWAPGVELPSRVLANVLDTIHDSKAVAEAYRKIFKVSSFDSEAKAEIKEAIKQLIVKWQIVKSTLDKETQGNG